MSGANRVERLTPISAPLLPEPHDAPRASVAPAARTVGRQLAPLHREAELAAEELRRGDQVDVAVALDRLHQWRPRNGLHLYPNRRRPRNTEQARTEHRRGLERLCFFSTTAALPLAYLREPPGPQSPGDNPPVMATRELPRRLASSDRSDQRRTLRRPFLGRWQHVGSSGPESDDRSFTVSHQTRQAAGSRAAAGHSWLRRRDREGEGARVSA